MVHVGLFLVDFLTRGAFFFELFALDPDRVLNHFEIWRVVTYMLVHDFNPPFLHILFNMLMLWMFGVAVCQELGERKFWWFYFLSGAFAGICSLVFYLATNNPTIIVGASGALFALMVAFARFFPTQQFLMFFIVPVQARYAVLIIGAIELLLITTNDRIAHIAHLGGALFAWIYLQWGSRLNPVEVWNLFQRESRQKTIRRKEEKLHTAMVDIDPILQKISEQGMQSLTKEEKAALDKVSEMKRQNRGNVIRMDDFRKKK